MTLAKKAFWVLWQTLKDTWEELYSLAIVNLMWFLAWALPIGLALATGIPILIVLAAILSLGLFGAATAGIYYVTNRVAHEKTFHFSDFIEGVKLYWRHSLLWMLGNMIIVGLTVLNYVKYPEIILRYLKVSPGTLWIAAISGLWLAVLVFWLVIQVYFWPILIQQEKPNLLLCWRNSAFLTLANPFYAFLIALFFLVLLGVCYVLVIPAVFLGMTAPALLGSNAVLTLLFNFGLIEDPRPKPLRQ